MKHINTFESFNRMNEEIKIKGKDLDLDDIIELFMRTSNFFDDISLKSVINDLKYSEDNHEIAKLLTEYTGGDLNIVFNDDTGYFNIIYDKQSNINDYKYDKFKYGLRPE